MNNVFKLLGSRRKQLSYFKIYDITTWLTNNYNYICCPISHFMLPNIKRPKYKIEAKNAQI